MAIVAAELKKYGAASRPEDDVSTSGGAIDTACILELTQPAAADSLRIVSDDAGDTTQDVTVTGLDAAGAAVTNTQTLNGVTPVNLVGTFDFVEKIEMTAVAVGSVTVESQTGGADIAVLAPNITDGFALFIGSASESGLTNRYEKEHWKNEHATLTLTSAILTLTADPASKIFVGVATAKDDSVSVANRETAPGSVTFVDDSVDVNVPGNQLEADSYIGLWIRMQLAADDAPVRSTYTTRLQGQTAP